MISLTNGHPRREVCYRADHIYGPYEKKVILETEFGGKGGVGQGTIVDTPDGRWYAIIFQDRDGVGRTPTLEPVRWLDGWPILTDWDGKIPYLMPVPVKGFEKKSIVYSDHFDSDKLALQWQWNHNPVDEAWSLTDRKGWLRLKTSRIAPHLPCSQYADKPYRGASMPRNNTSGLEQYEGWRRGWTLCLPRRCSLTVGCEERQTPIYCSNERVGGVDR